MKTQQQSVSGSVREAFSEGYRWVNSKGQSHRLDGPAIEWAEGSKEWWVDGKRHRLDGPAVEWVEWSKQWWVEGKRHRLDGPAIEDVNGNKEWWVDGLEVTESTYPQTVLIYKCKMVLES